MLENQSIEESKINATTIGNYNLKSRNKTPDAKDLIKYIVSNLVDHPDNIEVNEVKGNQSNIAICELKVNPKDFGQVIGKNGRIIKAIKTILISVGSKVGKKYLLDIDKQ